MYQTFDQKSSFSLLAIKGNSNPASAARGVVQVELGSVVTNSQPNLHLFPNSKPFFQFRIDLSNRAIGQVLKLTDVVIDT